MSGNIGNCQRRNCSEEGKQREMSHRTNQLTLLNRARKGGMASRCRDGRIWNQQEPSQQKRRDKSQVLTIPEELKGETSKELIE